MRKWRRRKEFFFGVVMTTTMMQLHYSLPHLSFLGVCVRVCVCSSENYRGRGVPISGFFGVGGRGMMMRRSSCLLASALIGLPKCISLEKEFNAKKFCFPFCFPNAQSSIF